jgi:hypothetical protein
MHARTARDPALYGPMHSEKLCASHFPRLVSAKRRRGGWPAPPSHARRLRLLSARSTRPGFALLRPLSPPAPPPQPALRPEERGVDVSGVQRTGAPTRDVYVVRQLNGDREFAGFGQPSDAYCDTRVDAARLPLGAIRVRRGGCPLGAGEEGGRAARRTSPRPPSGALQAARRAPGALRRPARCAAHPVTPLPPLLASPRTCL